MDIQYRRLKKHVESRHGEVTFDKIGEVITTCMEAAEKNTDDMDGNEKEEWVMDAIDRIWFEQTQRHIVDKDSEHNDTTHCTIEGIIRQMIKEVCKASKGMIHINGGGIPQLSRSDSISSTNSSFTFKRRKEKSLKGHE